VLGHDDLDNDDDNDIYMRSTGSQGESVVKGRVWSRGEYGQGESTVKGRVVEGRVVEGRVWSR
jgi:hypothetical protein